MKQVDENTPKIEVAKTNIDMDYEISKLNKTSKYKGLRSETLNITLVSLLLSMSTAVSFINVLLPLGITNVNIGFSLKYYIIAISFQVVGLYWGMIIGLLDGILQFIIWGQSPLFRFTSSIGLMLWVLLFWLFFSKLFCVYKVKTNFKKTTNLTVSALFVFITAPLISAILKAFQRYVEFGNLYGVIAFFESWISFMIFDLFAIVLFTLTTIRIQTIIDKKWK
ncbi:hypothetical protein [Spiroplasma turonicum]|uniref:ECF transporter S component n=1 Tax=Spiroplasma turonicum TaxID=216946 RepID=A0A0K1P5X6_9MOLU|nr:hypothetical protein [Spiroplasma turonicum]AKU79579.1 hypothetical protein STURON_00333 [Spiroplasma turonicum]ALX70601.1 hypothetical protein STURO_v1c03330 [Spiroplasma turonicum]